MRVGIIRLNAFHGLLETASRGYHETLTRVWLVVVARLRALGDAETSDVFVERHAAALGRDALFAHYSRARLMSVRARAVFVEPDLAPL